MTECMPISTPPLSYKLDRPGTSGVAVGPELAILAPESGGLHEDVKDRGGDSSAHTGRIAVRGLPVMGGYEHNAEANAASFDADGWFDTGDMGHLDADGFLFISGCPPLLRARGGA